MGIRSNSFTRFREQLTACFSRGVRDFRDGSELSDCPYEGKGLNQQRAAEWIKGFNAAEKKEKIMLTDSQKSKLIQVAAEMVHGKGMPPVFVSDWHLAKTTPAKTRRQIQEATDKSRKQCREWSKLIMSIVDAKD